MARIRNIKPETFDDPDLNALPFDLRWLFVGLWTEADRDGRLEDDPRLIKARLLPYDAIDCDAMLSALAPKFITRYTVKGRNFIQINNFVEHQKFHKDERSRNLPGPNRREPRASTLPTPCQHPAGTLPAPCQQAGILKSESGILKSGYSGAAAPAAPDPGFAQFQAGYPKGPNVGTFKHAAKAWKRLKPEQRAAALDALPDYAASEGATKEGGRFVPTPQKWLADEWWLRDFGRAEASRSAPRPPSNADAFGWCQHQPRCGTRAGHDLKLAREQSEQPA